MLSFRVHQRDLYDARQRDLYDARQHERDGAPRTGQTNPTRARVGARSPCLTYTMRYERAHVKAEVFPGGLEGEGAMARETTGDREGRAGPGDARCLVPLGTTTT